MKKNCKYLLLTSILLICSCNDEVNNSTPESLVPSLNESESSTIDSSDIKESSSMKESNSSTPIESVPEEEKYKETPTIYLAGDSTV